MKLLCRCCLSTDSSHFYDIFEPNKSGASCAENIHSLAEVQINQNDGLSQNICLDCYEETQRAYEFRLKVRHADQALRKEQETTKNQIDVNQMSSIHLLESEYFAPVEDNNTQVCVIDEMLEQENDPDVFMVEEIHDVEEINIMEQIPSSAQREDKSYNQKDNLLEDLALVAATQENVNIDKQNFQNYEFLPDDENDEDYLIEFDSTNTSNIKSQKWKCGECKVVLRGEVSYEGHMNLHRQTRPHTCNLCNTKYRCRAALKRHKDLKHSVTTQISDSNEKMLCQLCQKSFYSEINMYLHQAFVHTQSGKCPFGCEDTDEDNLKHHLECTHENDLVCVSETLFSDDLATSPTYQCFRCSETFQNLNLLQDHAKACQTMLEERLHDDNDVRNENIIEIIKLEESENSVKCTVCQKNLLKRNLRKHMELHERKEEEGNVLDDAKPYLCAYCPREFKNSKSLHQHEKINHAGSSDIVYVCADCERQYASQYLLETHRKQAHKERDNICKICGNAFKLRNQLMNHMKLHLEKNIPCPHCDKKYARQFDLNVHLRSHTGEQPYACHLCEKKFAIKVRLTYHLQKHYGIKHYCKECGAEFNSKQKLKAHSFKHTGMPYRCQMCDYHGFATRNTFKRHLTRVHHTSISEEALNEMFRKNTGKSVNIKQVDEHHLVVTASEDDNQDEIEVLGK